MARHRVPNLLFMLLAIPTALACKATNRNYGDTVNAGAGGGDQAGSGGDSGGAESGTSSAKGGRTSANGGSSKGGASAKGGQSNGSATGGTSAATSGGSTGGTTSAGGTSSTTTTAVTCQATEVPCSGTCINPLTNAANCGRCGHDCGAYATCNAGVCQAAPLLTEITGLAGLDVSDAGIFFSQDGTIQNCPSLTQPCLVPPTQIGSIRSAGEIAVTKTLQLNVVGVGGFVNLSDKHTGYLWCPVSGCGSVAIGGGGNGESVSGLMGYGGDLYYQYSGSGGAATSYLYRLVGANAGTVDTANKIAVGNQVAATSPIAIDDARAYFVRTDTAGTSPSLVSANRLTANTTFTTIASGAPTAIAAAGGTVYWTIDLPPKLCRRDAAAATAAVTIATNVPISPLVTDGTNVYLTNSTSIQYCVLPNCTGGIKTLVSGLSGHSGLRSHGNFLYWMVPSTTTTKGALYRIAKP